MQIAIPIAKPPWSKLGKELESALRKAIFDFSLIDQTTDKIAVALSGGKDSLSLLYLLHAIRGRGFPPFELYAIHMAGEFSCGAGIDGGFLKAICKELDVPFLLRSTEKKGDIKLF